MDQTISTLLSTLLGGLLTIGGGFLATALSQHIARKEDKQKAIRNMIEQIYKCVENIDEEYRNINKSKHAYDNAIGNLNVDSKSRELKNNLHQYTASVLEIQNSINVSLSQIDRTVQLYLPSLNKPYQAYADVINNTLIILEKQDTNPQYELEIESMIAAAQQFKKELVQLLKSKGYSYL